MSRAVNEAEEKLQPCRGYLSPYMARLQWIEWYNADFRQYDLANIV
jgi:hypothetical protein